MSTNDLIRGLFDCGVLLGALSLLGCATFEPAPPGRQGSGPAAVKQADWPKRQTEPLVEIANRPLRAEDIVSLSPDEFAEHLIVGKTPAAAPPGIQWSTFFRRVYGQGTVCEEIDPSSPSPRICVGPAPARRFQFVANRYAPAELQAARQSLRQSWSALKFLFNSMAFTLLEPAGKPRGLVFLISSWGGQSRETSVRDELLARGWAVLACSPPVRSRERLELTVEGPDAVERAAAAAAREIDDRLADAAYGAEAALLFLAEARPDLPRRPVYVIGCSAGAAVAPAVAARLAGSIDGLVLVGAGADLMKAGLASSFEGQPLRVKWADEPQKVDLERLDKAYLERSRLDPYWTALACRAIPVLLLQARWDQVVSSEGGEVLYERLGRPDRYLLPFGHTWLFLRLPAFRGAIADWLDRATKGSR